MLYIWPYFVFFSFPILYPFILNALIPQESLPMFLRSGSTKHQLPRMTVTVPAMGGMLAIVHYNTIVHPFTLADNRHYMFYVFRILLRYPIVKYLAVPLYFTCAWVVLTKLGGLPDQQDRPSVSARTRNEKKQRLRSTIPPSRPPPATGTRASFLLMWLLATTLSLITAPLVEPRYFIIPWLIWRMHVAGPRPVKDEEERSEASNSLISTSVRVLKDVFWVKHDHGLWLETAWFLFINGATAYIFLFWGYEWPQEPGNVQRFMW